MGNRFHSRRQMTLGDRLSSVFSALKYACCEPRAGDYDNCSNDEDIGKTGSLGGNEVYRGRQQQQQEQPRQRKQPHSVPSSETSESAAKCNRRHQVNDTNFGELFCRKHDQLSLNKIKASRSPSHEDFTAEVRSSDGDLSNGAWVDSPYTDATRMASPATQVSPVTNKKNPPTQDSRSGQVSVSSGDRHSGGMPPRAPTKKSRWTDDVLEGFLYSTLVDGTGLVLDKLDSEGKGKKCGERILSYDPDAMRLNWISTGMRRKPGSMLAKDIDDVLCEGTAVTIFYCRAAAENRGGGGGGAAAAAATPGRRRSLSPWRRSSMSTGQTKVGRRRKAFQVAEERDAQILAELMLFVRRRAVVAACTSAAGADAASSRSVDSPGASSASAGSSVSDAGSYPDGYGGGGISLTAADDAAGSGSGVVVGGRSKKSRRRSVL